MRAVTSSGSDNGVQHASRGPSPRLAGTGRRLAGCSSQDRYAASSTGSRCGRTILIVDSSGRTRAVLQTQDRGGPAAPTADAAVAATRAGRPVTIDGAWRLAARPLPDGTWLLAGQPVSGVQALHDRLVLGWAAMALLVLLVTVALTRHLIRYGLRPLTAIAREAARINAGDLTRRLPDGTPDEVGQLAAALNSMLDRVQNALHERHLADERLRRFVDDAGHELRTPVTAIRGWADLYGRGAVPDNEVPTAMRRIANEAERIGGLIDRLLLLASLDRPHPIAT
jgi:two-component system OmpR family sensor kinase